MISARQRSFRRLYRAFLYLFYDSFLKNVCYFSLGFFLAVYVIVKLTIIPVFNTPFFNDLYSMCRVYDSMDKH